MNAPRAALMVALLVSVNAARAADDEASGDLQKMVGQWTAKAGPEKDYTLIVDIMKDRTVRTTITTPQGDEYHIDGQVRVDEQASPKQLDWIKFKKPDGSEFEPNLAIYKFDGDKLVVCSGGPGRPRPAEFKAGEENRPSLMEFSRVKPKDADKDKDKDKDAAEKKDDK